MVLEKSKKDGHFGKTHSHTIEGGPHFAGIFQTNPALVSRLPTGADVGFSIVLSHAETGDIPHEMGTCYLSWSYEHVRALFAHYVGKEALIVPGEILFIHINC